MAHKSYYLYQRYIKIGDQDWVPTYPMEFSVSGDSEDPMPMVMKMDEDPACGGIPPMPPIYRWHQLPISEDYECSAGTKYYKEVYQVSYNNGLTWEDVVPEQTRRGDAYETGSSDCIEYRWIDIPISEDYICDECPNAEYRWTATTGYVCSGTNKMTREIEEVSYDSGTTWTPTGDERAAYPLIQADSEDCGYVPPTFQGKWKATYTGGSVTSADCDASSAITQNEIPINAIETVVIGGCVTTIDNYAFSNFSSLTSITLSNSITSIGDAAFYYCPLLTNLTIPSSVTNIGDYAFENCYAFTNITIPSSVNSIKQYTFMGCSGLTSINIPNSVTSIGGSAFYGCSSLTSIAIPDSVTSIGVDVFYGCTNLRSANIPSGVTTISQNTFAECSSLTSITIPSGVTSIGNSAFRACSSLTSVTVLATTPPTIGTYVFYNTNNCPIYVPATSVSAYKSATNWSSYSSRIQAIP